MREIIHVGHPRLAAYNGTMNATTPKKPAAKQPQKPSTPAAKPAPASQLRAQARRMMGKHYRAKYGVR